MTDEHRTRYYSMPQSNEESDCTSGVMEKTRRKDPQDGDQTRRHHAEDEDDEDVLKRLQALGLEGGTGGSGLLTDLRSGSPSRSPLARRTPNIARRSRSPSRSPLARRDGRCVRCVFAGDNAGCSRMPSVYLFAAANQQQRAVRRSVPIAE